jgi:hypothetical protein
VRIVVEATDLPRRDGVLVGVQVGKDVVDIVAATVSSARWAVDVDVVPTPDGGLDVRGRAVHGRRGDRFLYLSWGTRSAGDAFTMFRRAKLMLDAVDPETLQAADRDGTLLASLRLTAPDGSPRCAAVRPPDITWSAPSSPCPDCPKLNAHCRARPCRVSA